MMNGSKPSEVSSTSSKIQRKRIEVELRMKKLDIERRKEKMLLEFEQHQAELEAENLLLEVEESESGAAWQKERMQDFEDEDLSPPRLSSLLFEEQGETAERRDAEKKVRTEMEGKYQQERLRLENLEHEKRESEKGKLQLQEAHFESFLEEEDHRIRETNKEVKCKNEEERHRNQMEQEEELRRREADQLRLQQIQEKDEELMRRESERLQRFEKWKQGREEEQTEEFEYRERCRLEIERKREEEECQRREEEEQRMEFEYRERGRIEIGRKREEEECRRRGEEEQYRKTEEEYFHQLEYKSRKQEELLRHSEKTRTNSEVQSRSLHENSKLSYQPSEGANREIVELLAKTSLPDCEPSCFADDKTKYHTWKNEVETYIYPKLTKASEKLTYMNKYIKENSLAKGLVAPFVTQGSESALKLAWERLDRFFGNAIYVIHAHMEKLKKFPTIGNQDTNRLLEYASMLNVIHTDLAAINQASLLNQSEHVRQAIVKLPDDIIKQWEKHCRRKFPDPSTDIPFSELCEFVEAEAMARSDPRYGRDDILAAKNASTQGYGQGPRGRGQGQSYGQGQDRRPGWGWGETRSMPPKKALVTSGRQTTCLFCRRTNHSCYDCYQLQRCPFNVIRSFLIGHQLCSRCGGNRTSGSTHTCQTPSCKKCGQEHMTVFHDDGIGQYSKYNDDEEPDGGQKLPSKSPVEDPKSQSPSSSSPKRGSSSKTSSPKTEVDWSHIVQVEVFPKDKPDEKQLVYACVDPESNTCWIEHQFAEHSNWLDPSNTENMVLSTIQGSSEDSFLIVDNICLQSLDGETIQLPRLYTTDKIPASHENIPSLQDVRRYQHLSGIVSEIPEIDEDIPIVLLIGRNCSEAVGYRELIPYPGGEMPCALKTMFGWSITHCVEDGAKSKTCNKVHASISDKCSVIFEPQTKKSHESDPLTQRLIDLAEMDFIDSDVTRKQSRNETNFINAVGDSIRLHGNHYEINLPFKDKRRPVLPNNRNYAVKRLNGIASKMKSNDKFRADYSNFFRLMLEKGYMVKLPSDEQSPQATIGQFWYIPHHGVYHKVKGSLRVVYDVPAKFKGESLNDYLLTGPDLTASLFGALLRFRKDHCAIMCDIYKMFYSVRVPVEDQDYLRLVWYDYNDDGTIDYSKVVDYRMTTHVFGACSSPGCANYALKQVAIDNREEFSDSTVEFVRDHFYVDDGCTSVPDVETAIQLCQETMDMCDRAGFYVHKFNSNDKKLLQSIPAERCSVQLTEPGIPIPEARALGIIWDTENDVFRFRLSSLPDRPSTRSGILSVTHSVYDPLGLISPVILEGRLISQALCHYKDSRGLKLDWNDQIPSEYEARFLVWKSSLEILANNLNIPRCLLPLPSNFGKVVVAELHHYGDASESAIGCCSYLRVKDEQNRVSVSFVAGKSKVCPQTPITIPRKELVSAVVNTRLALQVEKELRTDSRLSTYPEVQHYFYSDSKIALAYIQNDSLALRLFCANRANFIAQNTDKLRWYHVPGENNPADYASRGVKAKDLTMDHPYLKGPEQLWSPLFDPCLCTPAAKFQLSDSDPELKSSKSKTSQKLKVSKATLRSGTTTERPDTANSAAPESKPEIVQPEAKRAPSVAVLLEPMIELVNRCSLLELAKNRVRLILKAMNCFKNSGAEKSTNPDDLAKKMNEALFVIIQQLQVTAYPEEFNQVRSKFSKMSVENCAVQASHSDLKELSPFYDAELGVLRVGGRLDKAEHLSTKERHPIIIPKQHHITFLLIDFYHRKSHHQGYGITLNLIRSAGLWIVNGPSQVKNHIKRCAICRRLRSGELVQRMCELPLPRTLPGLFEFVGIDVFGPFLVKLKRSTVKRYGCIFVCMASRAIHIEKLVDMSTDRFLNAMRRFINRRGNVKQFWCDRGTNFKGASNEITTTLDNMDESAIKTELASKYGTEYFRFGFPFSSHKNGHVERQICTVRSILDNILFEHKDILDDDVLETFFTETEGIVNSRPLSIQDIGDPYCTPISPMNILTLKSDVVTALPGIFDSEVRYSRRIYRRAQFLANEFWRQWKSRYLQGLQKRDKWFDEKRGLQAGDIVNVQDDTCHRNNWPLGKIQEIMRDSDGLVRKARVQMKDNVYDRPINKMRLVIPVEEM